MALDVTITQTGFFKKKITPSIFLQLLGPHYLFGIMNSAYVLEECEAEAINQHSVLIYHQQKIGRGFFFWLSDNGKTCHLSLNIPCTQQDISDFYAFIGKVCHLFSAKTFSEEEGALITNVSDIPARTDAVIAHNTRYFKQIVGEYRSLMMLGALNPVWLEEETLGLMNKLDEETLFRYLSDYLDKKQRHDYYYMKPTFFSKPGINIGSYTLTEGVTSIVPLEPYISFNAGLSKETEIDHWILSLVEENNHRLDVAGYINYQDLYRVIDLAKHPRYDARHAIVTLTREHIKALSPYFVELP